MAFSGGVDRCGAPSEHADATPHAAPCRSSLVAKLVHTEFPHNSIACIGLSAALPKSQLAIARDVAAHVGIPLREVATKVPTHPRTRTHAPTLPPTAVADWAEGSCALQEGEVEEYVANAGKSCFYCKSQLYSTLQGVADGFLREQGSNEQVRAGG